MIDINPCRDKKIKEVEAVVVGLDTAYGKDYPNLDKLASILNTHSRKIARILTVEEYRQMLAIIDGYNNMELIIKNIKRTADDLKHRIKVYSDRATKIQSTVFMIDRMTLNVNVPNYTAMEELAGAFIKRLSIAGMFAPKPVKTFVPKLIAVVLPKLKKGKH